MEPQFTIDWIPTEKLYTILPLAFLLNGERIPMEVLQNRLTEMIPMGYKCIGVYDQEELIGICGVWVLNKLYAGKHVEPDNVIVSPQYQGKGIGELMLDFLNDYAKEIGCERAEVNCYAKNVRGKKFWENQGYEALGIHLIKTY
ncbi:Acetyltransferase (GNAT) family protein [Flagellimonas taeanensis]|uniref:Acetyltransferase (GNAT) family protein n=1 Tax=Flagellimonas taeanensis TaxID=1005926 RepID=A0A1M7A170_9FLAO|nr:GNAT family N-acetyltransferase [Allomuricauda taeanensis]SFC26930.1 Acetyltransferase (GNAT) family protein [Allomuricauda taeanensis]SHL36464.1 Acetyltransferase (GNAT) family protein [Allomuricauda taeanensis]